MENSVHVIFLHMEHCQWTEMNRKLCAIAGSVHASENIHACKEWLDHHESLLSLGFIGSMKAIEHSPGLFALFSGYMIVLYLKHASYSNKEKILQNI